MCWSTPSRSGPNSFRPIVGVMSPSRSGPTQSAIPSSRSNAGCAAVWMWSHMCGPWTHALIEGARHAGYHCGAEPGFSGVWVGEGDTQRKITAIDNGKSARGRTRHGFALNVDPDLGMFEHVAAECGIRKWGVTSVTRERETLGLSPVTFETVVQAVASAFVQAIGASAEHGRRARRHQGSGLARPQPSHGRTPPGWFR